MASLTQWTLVWVISKSWWWTGRPGMLWSMGSQRIWHNWATELRRTVPGSPLSFSTCLPGLFWVCRLWCIWWASPIAHQVKNLPAMWETQEMLVPSLAREEPWRRKWQPIPAWRIPQTEESGSYSPKGDKELDTAERLSADYGVDVTFSAFVSESRWISPY